MSRMLNLVDRLLAMGRNLHKVGRDRDAVAALERLGQFPNLPGHVAEEVHARLGELYLGLKKFRRAHRHLALAVTHQPDHPHYHFLLAGLLERKGELERAAEHYRRSLELEPDQPRCLAAYGLLTMRQGDTEDGLTCLRCAAEMAPEDARTVRQLAKGLHRAGRYDEAERVLRLASFRNPQIRKLWENYRFRQLHREQARRYRAAQGERPALLPFVRLDGPSTHRPLGLFRDHHKRAQ